MEAEDIAYYAQLASILEASAPKPGNVNRVYDFADTKYEHFVIAGIALGGPALQAAKRGFDACIGEIKISEIKIGELIKEAVFLASKWTYGRNTNLGIAILLIPLCASAGMALSKKNDFRENIDPILKGTTYRDTLGLYAAIRHANLGGLGSSKRLDVMNPESDGEIKKDGINLYQIMKVTENNSIASELIHSYDISFNTGYPSIVDSIAEKDISGAIVHTHLTILSQIPDTLIARKNGIKTAEKVSEDAKKVLDGKMNINDFDSSLRSEDNRLNPGATADLVASSLFIALLKGDLL
jgi:triphosphoribosyl-dephospho-CoA synthase